MAYDGYRSSPNPYQMGNMTSDPNDPYGPPNPPYPSRHETDHLNMPQPQMPPSTSSTPNMEPYPAPPRPESTHSGHFHDAVSSAVNSSENTSYLSPDVLQQITATVIQQLKANGLDNASSLSGSSGPPPARSQSLQPPYTAADVAPRPHSESPPITSQRSGSGPFVDPMSKSYDTQPYVAPSAYSGDFPPRQATDTFSRRRESMSSQGSHRGEARPRPPERDTTAMEMTTLERIWGKLFEDGKPTKRLSQFLRGIAMHLIEDYPPGNTLVITPDKMQKFYADTNVSLDQYPWKDIFDDRTSSISRLFRDLKVQHHLVQPEDLQERPDIPGLTPQGFEKWATVMILAHPDLEYERLQKAVLNMPISNPDDKKERFPKEIPRRLFPESSDIQLREETEEYIMKHCGVDLPRITDDERNSRPSTAKRSPEPGVSSSGRARSYERGRPPPASVSSAVIDDDEDEKDQPTPSVSIERERKPYSAQPGGGKQYNGGGSNHSRTSTGSFSTSRPTDTPSNNTQHRTADKFDRDSRYGRTGSGATSRRFSRGSRSSSRGMNSRPSDYRHSESDLHSSRETAPRYEGISAADLYMESPTSIISDGDDGRRFKDHLPSRGSRSGAGAGSSNGEDYYRGMLGGHGGGPVKYYH